MPHPMDRRQAPFSFVTPTLHMNGAYSPVVLRQGRHSGGVERRGGWGARWACRQIRDGCSIAGCSHSAKLFEATTVADDEAKKAK